MPNAHLPTDSSSSSKTAAKLSDGVDDDKKKIEGKKKNCSSAPTCAASEEQSTASSSGRGSPVTFEIFLTNPDLPPVAPVSTNSADVPASNPVVTAAPSHPTPSTTSTTTTRDAPEPKVKHEEKPPATVMRDGQEPRNEQQPNQPDVYTPSPPTLRGRSDTNMTRDDITQIVVDAMARVPSDRNQRRESQDERLPRQRTTSNICDYSPRSDRSSGGGVSSFTQVAYDSLNDNIRFLENARARNNEMQSSMVGARHASRREIELNRLRAEVLRATRIEVARERELQQLRRELVLSESPYRNDREEESALYREYVHGPAEEQRVAMRLYREGHWRRNETRRNSTGNRSGSQGRASIVRNPYNTSPRENGHSGNNSGGNHRGARRSF